jgi:hypothetical protein
MTLVRVQVPIIVCHGRRDWLNGTKTYHDLCFYAAVFAAAWTPAAITPILHRGKAHSAKGKIPFLAQDFRARINAIKVRYLTSAVALGIADMIHIDAVVVVLLVVAWLRKQGRRLCSKILACRRCRHSHRIIVWQLAPKPMQVIPKWPFLTNLLCLCTHIRFSASIPV